jgi:hypothetical protein
MIWKGGDRYDRVTFDRRNNTQIYPFDTVDTVKRMLCYHFRQDSSFIPRFVFVGIPKENPYSEEAPTINTEYVSIDYLWYPTGTNDPTQTYSLLHPLKALLEGGDKRFVSRDGTYTSPNYEFRGRTMMEDVFLKPSQGKIPVFHVFPLSTLLQSYRGGNPIGEENWNKRFSPYFPDINRGSYDATPEDRAFAQKIHFFISHREKSVHRINEDLEEISLPHMDVTGVRQLLLTWPKPVEQFQGCAPLFYQIPVTKKRPYLRLFPAEGSAITKLHVEGVLPIPTLDDPVLLEVWSKESNPTPGTDYCSIKYVNRASMGDIQSIYGTVRVLNDGTMNLLLQPPTQIRYLDPVFDFRNFATTMEEVFNGLPQPFQHCKLKEIAVIFSLKTDLLAKKFTKDRLKARLPYFTRFFTEIAALPEENPILSYK